MRDPRHSPGDERRFHHPRGSGRGGWGFSDEEGPADFRAARSPRGGRRPGGHREWHSEMHPGFGGRGLGPPFFMKASRASRGDVRAAILTLLEEEPMHGYQIIRELAERSEGIWSPSPGSVYPTLQLLEDEGLVASDQSEGRRVYRLTEAGHGAVAERAGRPAPWEEVASEADSSLVALRALAVQLVVASRQVAHAGSPADVAKAKAVLTDARRAIYRILAESSAEDDPGDERT